MNKMIKFMLSDPICIDKLIKFALRMSELPVELNYAECLMEV